MKNKQEIIESPCCELETSVNSKKCSNCGEGLDDLDFEDVKKIEMDYITHNPTFFQKLEQVYWVNPKSCLLKRFKVNGGEIYIETLNGKIFSAPVSECKVRYAKDKYDRYEFIIKSGEQKIRFREISYMLDDDEWEDIINFCQYHIDDSDVSTLGKITSVMQKIMDTFDD